MDNLNRRSFLRKGIAGAAGAAMAPTILSTSIVRQEDKIAYRTLGRTGLRVPVISFGVMRADNPGLCKAAYERGITFFDTANGYQNGNNEIMLGNVFRDYSRNSFILATKVHAAGLDKDGLPTSDTTADKFLETFNTSLSRLGMDYVDILYLHGVSNPELFDYKPVMKAMKGLKKKGKIRFMGFSTHKNEHEVIEAAAMGKDWDVILTAYNFQHAFRKELESAIHKAAEAGIGIVAMKTLAGGGFLDKEKTKPMNTTAAIKWVLSNPDIHTTIPGMTTFDQLDLNTPILYDQTLTDQEKNDILIASSEPGMFCSGCRMCAESCKLKLPVQDLMRAYMYAYGYSSTSQAYDLLSELGTGADPCKSCMECAVKCSRHFNVREKIADISRLVNVPSDFLA
ncbi:MAG: aldo/keto reductase [Bacteroidales bacterium]|jgi:predicted aldo/keto reductase-like oxidoreductase|nr:aldo/keto reductase [Bacteroidales bacterium]